MYAVRYTETGNIIETFKDKKDALSVMKYYEELDKRDGVYEKGFYEVTKVGETPVRVG